MHPLQGAACRAQGLVRPPRRTGALPAASARQPASARSADAGGLGAASGGTGDKQDCPFSEKVLALLGGELAGGQKWEAQALLEGEMAGGQKWEAQALLGGEMAGW